MLDGWGPQGSSLGVVGPYYMTNYGHWSLIQAIWEASSGLDKGRWANPAWNLRDGWMFRSQGVKLKDWFVAGNFRFPLSKSMTIKNPLGTQLEEPLLLMLHIW